MGSWESSSRRCSERDSATTPREIKGVNEIERTCPINRKTVWMSLWRRISEQYMTMMNLKIGAREKGLATARTVKNVHWCQRNNRHEVSKYRTLIVVHEVSQRKGNPRHVGADQQKRNGNRFRVLFHDLCYQGIQIKSESPPKFKQDLDTREWNESQISVLHRQNRSVQCPEIQQSQFQVVLDTNWSIESILGHEASFSLYRCCWMRISETTCRA